MTMDRDEMTARENERQAEATRNRLADTLDELHDRLTPGHVLDEVLSYARFGGSGFMRALTNAARDNPLPTLLIGAGFAMFMAEKTGVMRRGRADDDGSGWRTGSSGSGWFGGMARGAADAAAGSAESMRSAAGTATGAVRDGAGALAAGVRDRAASVGNVVSGAAESVRNRMSDATTAVADTASSVGDSVAGAAGSVRNRVAETAASVSGAASSAAQQARRGLQDATARVSDTMGQVRQGAAELGESVQDYARSAGDQIADTAERTRQQAANAARQVKETTTSLIQEQPLLVAAIGLAVGAAIAAALPKSRLEDEFMGEASDAVKETIGEVASTQYEKAKAVAGSVAQEAMSKAKEEGLSVSGAMEAARGLGDKAKRVATETIESTASSLQDKGGGGQRS